MALTTIYFDSYIQPSSYKGLIEIVWITMCENNPTHGKYFLGLDRGIDRTASQNYPFPTKWYLEFTLLKQTHFNVRSFSPCLLRLPPIGTPIKIVKLIHSLRQPADFDINDITLNDILIIHAKLFDFMTDTIKEERKDWKAFFKTHSEDGEEKKDIIKAYSLATGIEINTLQERFNRNPELKRVAK